MGVESAVAIMSIEGERVIEAAGLLAEMQGLRLLGTIPKPLTVEKLQSLLDRVRESPRESPRAPAREPVRAPSADLGKAFVRGELLLLYQPKVRLPSGMFAGVEALVRWKHPELGLFQPASFVQQMEESDDFSAGLADFSLSAGIACAGRWRDAGRELRVAINLSARAFEQLDLPERIETLCRSAGVPLDFITLEVTETQLPRDHVRMVDVAARLRLKGLNLSVDDFGTGQSGFSKLQQLPFNELKIDQQFVHGCASNAGRRSVVEASLSLARSMRMTSVAEGVQQRQDLELLEQLGCDVMQGYLIGRPMNEAGLEAWVGQWALGQR